MAVNPEGQIVFVPVGDVLEIVAGGDRPTDHKQQNLRQRMRHPPRLTVVLDQRENGQPIAATVVSRESQATQRSPNHHRQRNQNPLKSETVVNPSSPPWTMAPPFDIS
jgi:hypothetical protein